MRAAPHAMGSTMRSPKAEAPDRVQQRGGNPSAQRDRQEQRHEAQFLLVHGDATEDRRQLLRENRRRAEDDVRPRRVGQHGKPGGFSNEERNRHAHTLLI